MTKFQGSSAHLHDCAFDPAFRDTHLGQAHLAGTGPAGKTCRECRFFGLVDTKNGGGLVSPGYYAKSSKELANTLKNGKCGAPMPHKANRRFPHYAKSCRLFEQAASPFPVSKPLAETADA